MERRRVRGLALGVAAAGAMALLSACGGGLTDQGDNTVNGKQLFVAKCGSCHILHRAGTKGVTGPNLDAAFARARQDGFKDSTFQGMVHRQIGQPAREPQVDPVTGKTLPLMPPDLVKGEDAADVAAYVASAVGKGGEVAYTFAAAESPPGQIEIDSPNESSVDHNIAVEGNGVNEAGPVVSNGGVSKVNADLKAGKYQFFCTVPGHRQAGMEGTLTVK